MSNQPRNPTVGGTLAGGIQDVSAILPIIGTDQCESHVGSALCGGYCYAAAAPLSIFGSLGIVKAGVAVLISTISIPKYWFSHRDLRPSGPKEKVRRSIFFGARMLDDAGFKLQGDVAALIGMDGTRFKAETKLIQILEEKHIDNPENISITWKSKQWNIMLVLFTIVAAAMSGIPYFALILGPASWRPTTHLPWLFPILRTVGSCLASVCCQFIIQSRVISSMKNRILFMAIHRQIADGLSTENKANLDDWLKYRLQWDPDLPAEQCIVNLGRFLASVDSVPQMNDEPKETEPHVSIEMKNLEIPPAAKTTSRFSTPSPIPLPPFHKDFNFNFNTLQDLCQRHFPSPTNDRTVILTSWIILLLSLPATVAGYVGCFTLVSASSENGPLAWLGLEAALSIVRILIWAWNPSFDENTEIAVELKLTEHQPLVTSEEHKPFILHSNAKDIDSLVLIPERRFLEGITAYSGPLDQFQTSENVALYFTLMTDYSASTAELRSIFGSLFLTVFDFNTRIGVTLVHLKGLFYYLGADVKYDTIYNEITADVQLPMTKTHSWRIQDGGLFDALEQYYNSVVRGLNSDSNEFHNIAKLEWNWNLSPKLIRHQISTTNPGLPRLTDHDVLYLDRGYEHHLKTILVDVWGRSITENMKYTAKDSRNDCYEALVDRTTEKAKWELTELERLLGWEWARREHILLLSSIILEEVLRSKLEKCIATVCEERKDTRLEQRMRSGFDTRRRKRLETQRREAKMRMEDAMKGAGERAKEEGLSWKDQEWHWAVPKWDEGIQFIDELWSKGISLGPGAMENAKYKVDDLAQINIPAHLQGTIMSGIVGQVKQRFEWRWHSQRENERREMDTAIDRIRSVDGQREETYSAYEYPGADSQGPRKFVWLPDSSSKGKACSAIVYDAWNCSAEVVCDVIQKSTTRSVIDVDSKIVASIPPNDHLLFLSCRGDGEEPAFVQRNRDRWWDQQTTNSALFYFTPQDIFHSSCSVSSGPIAQIFIVIKTPSRVRLRLLHQELGDSGIILSIQQKGKNLVTLSEGIPKGKFKLQDLDLEKIAPGRHALQVVVVPNSTKKHTNNKTYCLRDILIEFFDDPGQNSPASEDMDQINKIRPMI